MQIPECFIRWHLHIQCPFVENRNDIWLLGLKVKWWGSVNFIIFLIIILQSSISLITDLPNIERHTVVAKLVGIDCVKKAHCSLQNQVGVKCQISSCTCLQPLNLWNTACVFIFQISI